MAWSDRCCVRCGVCVYAHNACKPFCCHICGGPMVKEAKA
jgi:hypothetical protein